MVCALTRHVLNEYICIYRVVQKKIAQSLMKRHFATVCSRVMRFSPKCLEKNGQILNIVIKYSLFGDW